MDKKRWICGWFDESMGGGRGGKIARSLNGGVGGCIN